MVVTAMFMLVSMFGNTSADEFVSIRVLNVLNDNRSMGSGVLIDKTHVLTAAHVIRPGTPSFRFVECLNKDGTPKVVVATEAFFDEARDLALITINEECPGTKIQKLSKKNPTYGQTVFAIGCPDAFCGMVSKGVASAYKTKDGIKSLYSDIKTWFGSSGGPMFNVEGEVVGICSRIWNMSRIEIDNKSIDIMTNYYSVWVPSSEMQIFLNNIKNGKNK